MTILIRSYRWDTDFPYLQKFLSYTFNELNPFLNWFPSRFENIKFGLCGTEYLDEEDENLKVWGERARFVAITFVKPSGECWILISPDYRKREIDIIKWVEQTLHENQQLSAEENKPFFHVNKSDSDRGTLLSKMGYINQGSCGHNRARPVDLEVPSYSLPSGYKIRTVQILDDFEKYREVLGAVFPHCNNMTRSLALKYTQAKFYHPALNFVVVAPDERFAAFTTVRLDPVSLLAELEPVGVHPNHRKLGLAKAIVSEALIRLKPFNPRFIAILEAATNDGAQKLYDGLGFTKEDVQLWVKQ